MAYYWGIRRLTAKHRNHVAKRVLALRTALRKQVTETVNDGDLKIATWNLMHFGGTGGYHRSSESLQYIAEIIDHFDLVSIQEVKPDLKQFKILLKDYLGDDWDYIVSDTTQGTAGNDERMAVLYRKGRVQFSRVAGEIVLPPIKGPEGVTHPRQFARTPYFLGFRAGWFKFKLCSVHIHYGAKGGKDKHIRIEEIKQLAMQLTERSDRERAQEIKEARLRHWDETPSAANYVLLGDFNIHTSKDDASKDKPLTSLRALTENGFEVPKNIRKMSTNTGKDEEPFDQIALRLNDKRFEQGAGGVFDYRRLIYRSEDSEFYRTLRTKGKKWPAGLEKLKAQEDKLKAKAKKLPAEAKKMTEQAKQLTEQANQLTEAAAKKKMSGKATKLTKKAKELTEQLKKKDFLESYVADGINDYFLQYYRKNQISDHLLLWTSFKIDYANAYLAQLASDNS